MTSLNDPRASGEYFFCNAVASLKRKIYDAIETAAGSGEFRTTLTMPATLTSQQVDTLFGKHLKERGFTYQYYAQSRIFSITWNNQ